MKKLILTGAAAFFLAGMAVANTTGEKTSEVITVDGSYKIVNDTDEKVRIHTGYGETTLNPNGGSTSVTCDPGKKVKVDGDVIFTVTDDMCGNTVKLSEYL